jgi:hypothetical protein
MCCIGQFQAYFHQEGHFVSSFGAIRCPAILNAVGAVALNRLDGDEMIGRLSAESWCFLPEFPRIDSRHLREEAPLSTVFAEEDRTTTGPRGYYGAVCTDSSAGTDVDDQYHAMLNVCLGALLCSIRVETLT